MITKYNIQDWVQIWVLRGIYTKEQGQVIVYAVMAGFDIEVGQEKIPSEKGHKIEMECKLTLTVK